MANGRKVTLYIHPDDNNNNDGTSSVSLTYDIIRYVVGGFLDQQSKGRLSRTSRGLNSIFKTPLMEAKYASMLLQYVMKGEEGNANMLLTKLKASYPDLYGRVPLKKCQGTEDCGKDQTGQKRERKWLQPVSALEYAAWAGDTFMVDMLLQHIPDDYKHFALGQLRGVREKGTEQGRHLSVYQPLIAAYVTYDAHCAVWDWTQRDHYWVNVIGVAIANMPENWRQEMCGKVAFNPVPAFDQAPLRSTTLYDGYGSRSLSPVSSSDLGTHFAVYRGSNPKCLFLFSLSAVGSSGVTSELAALRRFCDVRTNDLVRQISLLEQHKCEPKVKKRRAM